MPGKSPKTRYGEFRHFAEWQRRGRYRIKRELLPPMAAWLLMLANRYRRAVDGMRSKLITDTVPGMGESLRRMEFAVEHLTWLMDALTETFGQEDWAPAVAEVCRLMEIHAESLPIADIPDDQFQGLIPAEPHADDAR